MTHSPGDHKQYIGRFAPSPTGPLHFGSLLACIASYLDAKHQNGLWLLRIDDIDQQRCKPEYTSTILQTLESIGFEWDGEIVYQQNNQQRYAAVLNDLIEKQLTYRCRCSRKNLPQGPYPGTCRELNVRELEHSSIRIKTSNKLISVNDLIQGAFSQNISKDIGDFIIYRADNTFNYHLVTVIDDYDAKISHIIRGSDLLDSTPRQIFLQQQLGFNTPCYSHIPVATNRLGEKLSKQTGAKAICSDNYSHHLFNALDFLGQKPDQKLIAAEPEELLNWGIKNWNLNSIAKSYSICMES